MKKPYFKHRQGYASTLCGILGNPRFVLVFQELMTYWIPPKSPSDIASRMFPSERTLAIHCGVDERSIARAFTAFRKTGILVQVGTENRSPAWEVPETTRLRLGI